MKTRIPSSTGRTAFTLFKGFVALVIAVTIALPVVWCVVLSLKTQQDIFVNPLALPVVPQWDNYTKAWNTMGFFSLLKNTLFVSFFSISVGLSLVILASFAIARMRFGSGRLQNAVYLYFMSGLIIPTFVLLMPIYMMVSSAGLLNNLWGVILPYWGWTASMNTMIIVGIFKNVPITLDEAAAIDGCGCFGIFFHIDLPLIKTAVITCLIICFLGCWNEYPLTSIIINSASLQTVALAASKFRGLYSTDYASMAAGLIILSVPQIIFFSFFQKYIVEGMCSGAVKA